MLCARAGRRPSLAGCRAARPILLPGAPGSPGARPRIGLVLGGGGAKGGAHIGVLKVLEEMRMPVDCIAGTSMGAIVGAAYATGMPAEELAKIVSDVNWKETLESAPREGYTVRRKALDFLFTNGFELGVKDGKLVFPGGIVPTQQIEGLFRRIVAGARQTPNFDRLPIPFRAVATDLESGDMKVFDRGDLAVAMRASMAVPAAFAPVEVDGRLYVDGMLVRNLPVDVARKLCADVIIAVPLGNPVASRENLGNALAVAGQAMNIAIEVEREGAARHAHRQGRVHSGHPQGHQLGGFLQGAGGDPDRRGRRAQCRCVAGALQPAAARIRRVARRPAEGYGGGESDHRRSAPGRPQGDQSGGGADLHRRPSPAKSTIRRRRRRTRRTWSSAATTPRSAASW